MLERRDLSVPMDYAPLPRLAAAASARLFGPPLRHPVDRTPWGTRILPQLAQRVLYLENDADRLLFWGRLAFLPLHLGLALAVFLASRGVRRIKLAYFGTPLPEYYGFAFDWLPSFGSLNNHEGQVEVSEGDWLAVSATCPQGFYFQDMSKYRFLDAWEPVDVIGNSIYVYHLVPEQRRRSRGPGGSGSKGRGAFSPDSRLRTEVGGLSPRSRRRPRAAPPSRSSCPRGAGCARPPGSRRPSCRRAS